MVEAELYGFIDKEGNWIVEPRFESAYSFSEGMAAVRLDDNWGYIDSNGNMVIEPKYKDALGFSEGLAPVQVLVEVPDT